jgi:hypothetical protein
MQVPMLELPRTTVRKIKEGHFDGWRPTPDERTTLTLSESCGGLLGIG